MAGKWSVELLNVARSRAEADFANAWFEKDPKIALEDFLQRVLHEPKKPNGAQDAYRVYCGIACIQLLAGSSLPAQTMIPRLRTVVRGLILRNQAQSPKQVFLKFCQAIARAFGYTLIHNALVEIDHLDDSMAELLYMSNYQKPAELGQLLSAHIALNKGYPLVSAAIHQRLGNEATSKFWRQVAIIGEVKSLRLSAQKGKNDALLQQLEGVKIYRRLREHLEWERLMSRIGKMGLDSALIHQSDEIIRSSYGARLGLLLYAQPNLQSFQARLIKMRQLRLSSKKIILDPKTRLSLRVWEVLDRLYDLSQPIEMRLHQAQSISGLLGRLHIESRLLGLVALYRWSVNQGQQHMSLALESEYRSLNLRLSQGYHSDILNLMSDLRPSHKPKEPVFAPDEEPTIRIEIAEMLDAM